MDPQAFFIEAKDGSRRFCVKHPAAGLKRGKILYLHPFAEEMNKCRRMAALSSRAFAAAGFEVLQIDLLGCGDSSGDFGEASWQAWLDDVILARDHLTSDDGSPLYLWGVRAGCLLASQSAHVQPAGLSGQIWWQPPVAGKSLCQQWLRLKLTNSMLGGAGKVTVDGLRQQMRAGASLEIAGYNCAPSLLEGLDGVVLHQPRDDQNVAWFELVREAGPSLLPASMKTLQSWPAAPSCLHTENVVGPAFWQTTEVEIAPALIDATLDWLQ